MQSVSQTGIWPSWVTGVKLQNNRTMGEDKPRQEEVGMDSKVQREKSRKRRLFWEVVKYLQWQKKKSLHKNAQHKNSENIFHLQTNLHMGVRILGYEMGQENGFVGGLNPVQMQNWMGISLSRFVLIGF